MSYATTVPGFLISEKAAYSSCWTLRWNIHLAALRQPLPVKKQQLDSLGLRRGEGRDPSEWSCCNEKEKNQMIWQSVKEVRMWQRKEQEELK